MWGCRVDSSGPFTCTIYKGPKPEIPKPRPLDSAEGLDTVGSQAGPRGGPGDGVGVCPGASPKPQTLNPEQGSAVLFCWLNLVTLRLWGLLAFRRFRSLGLLRNFKEFRPFRA